MSKFCEDCGASLGEASAASTKKSNDDLVRIVEAPPAQDIEGERKMVTALFADIKGSTELEQNLDPEEARAIIDPALKIMIDAARRYDGYVQSTGDGIFALFGAPLAHEDHPQRALHAALRMQQEIHPYGDRLLQRCGAVFSLAEPQQSLATIFLKLRPQVRTEETPTFFRDKAVGSDGLFE